MFATTKAVLLAALLGAAGVHSHFLLNYPTTVGFVDDDEGTSESKAFSLPLVIMMNSR